METQTHLTQHQQPILPPRILRRRQVEAMTGLGKSQLYSLIKAGNFVLQIPLTAKTVGWIESEVIAWIQSRVDASRKRDGGVE